MTKSVSINQPVSVFFSYAHQDELFREKFTKHLRILERQGIISAWSDRQITAGTNWQGVIDEKLESAQVILLFISPDFLASDYCHDVEMEKALERHESGDATVIPILLRDVAWENSAIANLQILPTGAKPITRWKDEDEAFADIIRNICKVINPDPLKQLNLVKGATSKKPNQIFSKGKFILISILIFIIGAIFYSIWLKTQPQIIRVQPKVPYSRQQADYYIDLLKLALNETKSEGDFKIKIIETQSPQFDRLIYLRDNKVDVVWTMTTFDRELVAKPIRIPVTRGLLGHRICLIQKNKKRIFDNVESMDDFIDSEYSIGQLRGWPDVEILNESKILVKKNYQKYDSLFLALERGEFDCFARGANEVLKELRSNHLLDYDENLVFKYRSPVYFFVDQNNTSLANRIHKGLDIALNNGRFCSLFMSYFREDILKLDIPSRTVISIPYTPPPQTPGGLFIDFESRDSLVYKGKCSSWEGQR